MSRTLADSLRWMRDGTALFSRQVSSMDADQWDLPTGLPGWSRRMLVAHVASNAEAIGNLVHWASTGVETPMYASPHSRLEQIETGSRRQPAELREWSSSSSLGLAAAIGVLGGHQWDAPVVTAQGRTVTAAELPWMRAREVMVHSVDLGSGVTFGDLPVDFLVALRADIISKRGVVPDVAGPLPQVVAWLTGRPYEGVIGSQGAEVLPLDPWL